MPVSQIQLGRWDLAVVLLYFMATLVLGLWSAWKARRSTSRGFFVAERTLPWWMIGLTMVAASISAEQMLGEVAVARDYGLVVSNWDIGVFPALLLMLFVFLPLYLRSGITTIPEYLERRFGRSTRVLFAGYTVFNNACILLPMVLALGVTALERFTGINESWGPTGGPLLSAVMLIVFTGIYTVAGGMLAVAWTQTLQCVLLLSGGLLITGVALWRLPGGWTALLDHLDNQQLDHLVRPSTDPILPWPGLLLLMLSTNVWYCCTNQFYVQSCLGAKDERHGRLGVLLTAFLAPVLTLCHAFPGYLAGALASAGLIERTAEPNAAYPNLVMTLLPAGLRGFIVAAVLGAIMSTIAAVVNATASVFTNDLYALQLRREARPKELVRVGRGAGLVTMLIALPLTFVAIGYDYIFLYSQLAWSILAIPIMLVFTFGALWRRTSTRAANSAFLIVLPFVALPFIYGDRLPMPGDRQPVHLFNFAFGLWCAVAIFLVVVSLLTRPAPIEKIASYVWRPGMNRTPAGQRAYPWYQSVEFWALVAGVMTLGLYVIFW